MTPPNELSAAEIAEQVRSGALSVREIAESIIARIEARDPAVRAWSYCEPRRILQQADRLDRAPEKGMLHGVPVGVKDVIATADMPTEHNNSRYAGSRPGVDAACVDTLRSCGALVVGKTATTEFAATSHGGPTRNPHDPERTPGGSSSGSGAAAADFQAAVTLGTQTGGSTIRPGSFNGVFAWKPTWNSISREGLKMYSATLDTLGLYARTARDLALLADVFHLDALEAPAPRSLQGVRIGLCRTPEWERALPATRQAIDVGAQALRQAGAEVDELELPPVFDSIYPTHRTILRREGRAAFLNEYLASADLDESFRRMVEEADGVDSNGWSAAGLTTEDYRAAYRTADQCRAAFDDIAARYEVVLAPSAVGEAPRGLANTGDSVFNSLWTLLQVPVVNVPGFVGPGGMPVGLSLVARRYQDRKLIGFAELVAACFSGYAADMRSAAM